MRIREMIERFGGVCEGDASVDIAGVMGVETAGPSDATFATDEKRLAQAEASSAGCVIVPRSMRRSPKTLLRCDSPERYAADLLELFYPSAPPTPGIHPSAVVGRGADIDPSACIGPHVTIGAGCRIGARATVMASVVVGDDCWVGDESELYPHVTLYPRTRIGARVIIHAGAVIGADGFGFFPDEGKLRKWTHVGCVVIEDDVEIGANTCVDRAKFGVTLIQQGAKIDNLVQIAHHCRVGRHAVLAGQTGLSGSVVIEDWVQCGGQVGVADHKTVGRGATIGAQSGIFEDIPPGLRAFGLPAKAARSAIQEIAMLTWLTQNRTALRKLIRSVEGR